MKIVLTGAVEMPLGTSVPVGVAQPLQPREQVAPAVPILKSSATAKRWCLWALSCKAQRPTTRSTRAPSGPAAPFLTR
jgi:hypothetical protein